MKSNRRSKRALMCIVSVGCILAGAAPAMAGPPLATDDAGTVGAGKMEVELNGSYGYDREVVGGSVRTKTADAEVKIATGLYRNLGVSLAIPYIINERTESDGAVSNVDGPGDVTLEVKYVFAEAAGITFAVKPVIIVPTGRYNNGLSEGRWQFGATLIATTELAEGVYALHANLGYERHTYRVDEIRETTRSDFWSGSIAGEAEVVRGIHVVVDVGLATNPDKASRDLPAYALAGARYEINDYLDINAGVKLGLTKPEDDVSVQYGLVMKF